MTQFYHPPHLDLFVIPVDVTYFGNTFLSVIPIGPRQRAGGIEGSLLEVGLINEQNNCFIV